MSDRPCEQLCVCLSGGRGSGTREGLGWESLAPPRAPLVPGSPRRGLATRGANVPVAPWVHASSKRGWGPRPRAGAGKALTLVSRSLSLPRAMTRLWPHIMDEWPLQQHEARWGESASHPSASQGATAPWATLPPHDGARNPSPPHFSHPILAFVAKMRRQGPQRTSARMGCQRRGRQARTRPSWPYPGSRGRAGQTRPSRKCSCPRTRIAWSQAETSERVSRNGSHGISAAGRS